MSILAVLTLASASKTAHADDLEYYNNLPPSAKETLEASFSGLDPEERAVMIRSLNSTMKFQDKNPEAAKKMQGMNVHNAETITDEQKNAFMQYREQLSEDSGDKISISEQNQIHQETKNVMNNQIEESGGYENWSQETTRLVNENRARYGIEEQVTEEDLKNGYAYTQEMGE